MVIAALRRLRMTAAEIAEVLGMPLSTVSAVLTRIGLGKLSRLEPVEPPNRYEKELPGELVHIDVKKLGRIERAGHRVTGQPAREPGWEYVHVCVDDATRLAYVEVLADEKAVTAVGFLRRAVAHFAAYGIRVERVMTDNGSGYRSIVHALACKTLGIKHLRTRPYRPRTNGKAERFIRTMLGGWAYGAIYRDSDERRHALTGWLVTYTRRRPAPQHRLPSLASGAFTNGSTGTTSSGPTARRRRLHGEELGERVVQRAFVVDQLQCRRAGPLEEGPVDPQPREAEVREARLPRAEQLALAAQLEVDLGQLEAVRGLDERLETAAGALGQLLLRPRDQQAVRLLGPASRRGRGAGGAGRARSGRPPARSSPSRSARRRRPRSPSSRPARPARPR